MLSVFQEPHHSRSFLRFQYPCFVEELNFYFFVYYLKNIYHKAAMVSLPFLISFTFLHDPSLRIVVTNFRYYSISIEKIQVMIIVLKEKFNYYFSIRFGFIVGVTLSEQVSPA